MDRAKVLGTGANGAVWLVKCRRTGRAFAAKPLGAKKALFRPAFLEVLLPAGHLRTEVRLGGRPLNQILHV